MAEGELRREQGWPVFRMGGSPKQPDAGRQHGRIGGPQRRPDRQKERQPRRHARRQHAAGQDHRHHERSRRQRPGARQHDGTVGHPLQQARQQERHRHRPGAVGG